MVWCENRERAFEYDFVRRAELEFAARMKCRRLLGQWAAREMKLTRDETASYCDELTKFTLRHPEEDALFTKLQADLRMRNVDTSKAELRSKNRELLERQFSRMAVPIWAQPY